VPDVRSVVWVVKEELGKGGELLRPRTKGALVVEEFAVDLKALEAVRRVKTGVLCIVNGRKRQRSIISTDVLTKTPPAGVLLG
jgi:hypothetical protein